jgi:cation diffusion facilitator family transporter
MILIIGFELGKSSVEKILSPTAVEFSVPVAVVLVASILVKLWMSLFNRKLGNFISSTTLQATAADSRNDAISTTAVLVATLIELFTSWKIDGFMGLAVAAFILYSGINLARETISPLLGEDAGTELRELIISVLEDHPEVFGYHDLMVHDYGPGQRFASMHVEMDQQADPLECHELIDNLERECLKLHQVHLVLHYDPVVTNDPEQDRIRQIVQQLLRNEDARISIHDFRMVRGKGHTNLIFDAALPPERMQDKKNIKRRLDEALNAMEETTYYTVVTFDLATFN